MNDPKLEAATHDGTELTHDGTELTHEEYIEALEEMGIPTEGIEDFEGRLTPESVTQLADAFEEFSMVLSGGNFGEMREMYQKLEPKHARSPKRHSLHKRAVERRRKRKNGGKK